MTPADIAALFCVLLVAQACAIVASDILKAALERRRTHRQVIELTKMAMQRFHEKKKERKK